ncbi:MAG: NAD(P)H-hydrate dehydratase [Candidatus Bathyarchaeota archaeon]|nr:MAG: NAD(P)H-hydrate dehydratase [Candidatus Bathyarchaeota archaeon]
MELGVITSREMRSLEVNAEYFGISRLQLMENAGHAIASEISARFPSKKTRIAVFCGLGGNGGDGFVATRHLLSSGYMVEVVVAGKASDIMHEATLKNWLALQPFRNSLLIHEVSDTSQVPTIRADVIVDSLLGIGLKGVPRQPILQLIKTINSMETFCLAVDTPSGLNSDSGEVLEEATKADLTVTFYKAKPGLRSSREHVGELVIRNIGLPETLEKFTGPGDVILATKPRPAESHKGDFGKLLVVGGSEVYSGAPALVTLAALRTGVDLVYTATPEKVAYAISSFTPNMVTIKLEGSHLNRANITKINQFLGKVTAVVMGPGLGLHEETKKTAEEIVTSVEEAGLPLLLDADGLRAFAEFKRPLQVPLVLTPHAREYSVLTGKELPSSQEDRVEKVKKVAQKLGAVVLLKGSTDIVSDGERVKLNLTGNPGMTVGGTGDVLSGVVGAFMSQKINPFEAAVAGAFVNGAAGDFVKDERGYHMVATDLLDWIPRIMDNPTMHSKVAKIGS